MPHLTIEYSKNIEQEISPIKLLHAVHVSLDGCPGLDMSRLKSRLVLSQEVLNEKDARQIGLVHVTLSVLTGKSATEKKTYGQTIFDTLKKFVPANAAEKSSLTVEVREIDPDFYFR